MDTNSKMSPRSTEALLCSRDVWGHLVGLTNTFYRLQKTVLPESVDESTVNSECKEEHSSSTSDGGALTEKRPFNDAVSALKSLGPKVKSINQKGNIVNVVLSCECDTGVEFASADSNTDFPDNRHESEHSKFSENSKLFTPTNDLSESSCHLHSDRYKECPHLVSSPGTNDTTYQNDTKKFVLYDDTFADNKSNQQISRNLRSSENGSFVDSTNDYPDATYSYFGPERITEEHVNTTYQNKSTTCISPKDESFHDAEIDKRPEHLRFSRNITLPKENSNYDYSDISSGYANYVQTNETCDQSPQYPNSTNVYDYALDTDNFRDKSSMVHDLSHSTNEMPNVTNMNVVLERNEGGMRCNNDFQIKRTHQYNGIECFPSGDMFVNNTYSRRELMHSRFSECDRLPIVRSTSEYPQANDHSYCENSITSTKTAPYFSLSQYPTFTGSADNRDTYRLGKNESVRHIHETNDLPIPKVLPNGETHEFFPPEEKQESSHWRITSRTNERIDQNNLMEYNSSDAYCARNRQDSSSLDSTFKGKSDVLLKHVHESTYLHPHATDISRNERENCCPIINENRRTNIRQNISKHISDSMFLVPSVTPRNWVGRRTEHLARSTANVPQNLTKIGSKDCTKNVSKSITKDNTSISADGLQEKRKLIISTLKAPVRLSSPFIPQSIELAVPTTRSGRKIFLRRCSCCSPDIRQPRRQYPGIRQMFVNDMRCTNNLQRSSQF